MKPINPDDSVVSEIILAVIDMNSKRLEKVFSSIEFANVYPGLGWAFLLKKNAPNSVQVVSGEVAIERVLNNEIAPNKVFIVGSPHSKCMDSLIEYGCIPLVMTWAESPIYDPFSYDHMLLSKSKFLFSFSYAYSQVCGSATQTTNGGNYQLFFPSFFRDNLEKYCHTGVGKRQNKIVFVASNKFIPYQLKYIFKRRMDGLWLIKQHIKALILSKTYRLSLKKALFRKRLDLLHAFSKIGRIDLYGRHWDDFSIYPRSKRIAMKDLISSSYKGECGNKLDLLSGYVFGLCIENVEHPRFITEKIFDCFVSGVIPLYYGAPDVSDYIPDNAYINLRNFYNTDEILDYIFNLTDEDIEVYQKNGEKFIKSKYADKWSYDYFSDWVHDTVSP